MKEDELREFIGDDGHFSTMFDFSAAVLSEGDKGWHTGREVTFGEWRSALFESQLEGQKVGLRPISLKTMTSQGARPATCPLMLKILRGSKCWELPAYCFGGFPLSIRGRSWE